MNAMTDLFGGTLVDDVPAMVPGLTAKADLIDAATEARLIAAIDREALSPFKFQGWLGKRLTISFGFHYDFERGQFGATDPIPDWLAPIKARAAAFAGVPDDDLVQALLIRYDPGAGIGWHKDRPVFEHVVGISLGAPATLRLRRRTAKGFNRATAPLVPRSVYHLTGEVRHDWEHSIAEMDETRWSITFRSFSEKGLRAMR